MQTDQLFLLCYRILPQRLLYIALSGMKYRLSISCNTGRARLAQYVIGDVPSSVIFNVSMQIVLYRWSFGVTLWEIFSQGTYKVLVIMQCVHFCFCWRGQTLSHAGLFPYPALADHEVLAAVKGANHLDCPEECGFKVWVQHVRVH